MIYIEKSITGKRFGRLVAIDRVDDHISASGRKEIMYRCICDCGNEKIARKASLVIGNIRSCGCLRSEVSRAQLRTHGLTGTSLHNRWRLMMERCYNPHNKSYKNYGAKGITVCDEWHNADAFATWSMKNGYDERLTIDRIDSTKGYSPENCRWVDRKVQNNNTSRNHCITFNGQTKTMAQWSEDTGLPYSTIKSRLNKHGWSIERALTTPLNR